MDINTAYNFINFIANKEQRGNFTGTQFNMAAPIAQIELISNLLGNEERLDRNGIPPYGYKSNRKIDTLLQPLVTGPVPVTVASDGTWDYPDGYLWPDAVHKSDYTRIKIVDSDEFPDVKTSVIHPPTADYPVIVLRNPKGYIDPNNIGTFQMSYVKTPVAPVRQFTIVNDEEVYDPVGSVDFALAPIAHLRICMKILQNLGINLDMMQVTQYASIKEKEGL